MSITISDTGIDVNIVKETRSPQQQDFGSLAFVNPTNRQDDLVTRIKRYTSLEDLSLDYDTDSGAYHAGLYWWSQEPMPKDFYVIGAGITSPASFASSNIDFTGSTPTGMDVVIMIDDIRFKYTTTPTDTDADVAEAVGALIGVHPWFDVNVAGAIIDIQGAWNGDFFNTLIIEDLSNDSGLVIDITQFTGGANATLEPIQDVLADAELKDGGFYAVALDRHFRTDVQQMTDCGDWCEATERIFMSQTNDKAVVDPQSTSDLASLFASKGYGRTCLFYTRSPIDYVEIGAFAILATTSFRGTNTVKTLKFKDVKLATYESISGAELEAIKHKNCNVLVSTAGIKMIHDGRVSSGEWLDVPHGADALAEEIRVRVFGALSRTSTKIPYTERGMDMLKYEVESALIQYEGNGFIASDIDEDGNELPAYEIWSGRVIHASPVDKSHRVAPDITFKARLAGAVHTVQINGKLTL